jgi:hypothetical protein
MSNSRRSWKSRTGPWRAVSLSLSTWRKVAGSAEEDRRQQDESGAEREIQLPGFDRSLHVGQSIAEMIMAGN